MKKTTQSASAAYYSLEKYQKALEVSKTDSDLIQNVFLPICDAVMPKYRWRGALADLRSDAVNDSIFYCWKYAQSHELSPSVESLRSLIRIAKASAAQVLRAYKKQTQSNPQKKPDQHNDFDNNYDDHDEQYMYISEFDDSRDNTTKSHSFVDNEDSFINQIDNGRLIEKLLSSNDKKLLIQLAANSASAFNVLDKYETPPTVCSFTKELRSEMSPLLKAAGFKEDAINTFFTHMIDSLGGNDATLDLNKMRNKFYNRQKTNIFSSIIDLL